MESVNTKLIRILQLLGIFFLFAAGFIAVINVVIASLDWKLQDAIFFLAFILICGLSFGISGLMQENPDGIRKLFIEWLLVVAFILIWAIWVYVQL